MQTHDCFTTALLVNLELEIDDNAQQSGLELPVNFAKCFDGILQTRAQAGIRRSILNIAFSSLVPSKPIFSSSSRIEG